MRTTDEIYQTIGRNIRALRRSRGLSQSDLAACVNVSRASIGMVETGRQTLCIHKAIRLAAALNTSLAALIYSAEMTGHIHKVEK